MTTGWLEREDGWLGPQRMDVPAPLPPVLRDVLERVVYWVPVRCPGCGCEKCPVKSTRGVYRHHKCQDCGRCFKSVPRK